MTAPRLRRLRAYDEHCLRVETPARPLQVGILARVDGHPLCDPDGTLRLADIRRAIEARLTDVPELRRVVYHPGRLAGRPLWVDDPAFRIERHVDEVPVAAPGDEQALLALTERLMAPPLDRARPLWRLWFISGVRDGSTGLLVVFHHALADGRTAMRLARALLDVPLPPPGAPPAPDSQQPWRAEAPPPRARLVLDNLRSMAGTASLVVSPAAWRRLAAVVRYGRRAAELGRGVPPSSLNAPVGPRRRLATVPLDLPAARRIARSQGCGVVDVVLAVITGGVRALLAARGEPVDLLRPRAGVAVSLFSPERAAAVGNDVGTLHVPLPVGEPDPAARLPVIADARARAAGDPMVAAEPWLRATMGRLAPVRRSMEHQRVVNLSVTYLPGPPVRIELLGAPLTGLVPIAPLAGNLALSFVALSYAGGLAVTVRADAERFPDLDRLTAAMARDWGALAAALAAVPPGSRPVATPGA